MEVTSSSLMVEDGHSIPILTSYNQASQSKGTKMGKGNLLLWRKSFPNISTSNSLIRNSDKVVRKLNTLYLQTLWQKTEKEKIQEAWSSQMTPDVEHRYLFSGR